MGVGGKPIANKSNPRAQIGVAAGWMLMNEAKAAAQGCPVCGIAGTVRRGMRCRVEATKGLTGWLAGCVRLAILNAESESRIIGLSVVVESRTWLQVCAHGERSPRALIACARRMMRAASRCAHTQSPTGSVARKAVLVCRHCAIDARGHVAAAIGRHLVICRGSPRASARSARRIAAHAHVCR